MGKVKMVTHRMIFNCALINDFIQRASYHS